MLGPADPARQKYPASQSPVGSDKPGREQSEPVRHTRQLQQKEPNLAKVHAFVRHPYVPAGQGRQLSGVETPSWLWTVPGGHGNSRPRASPGGQ